MAFSQCHARLDLDSCGEKITPHSDLTLTSRAPASQSCITPPSRSHLHLKPTRLGPNHKVTREVKIDTRYIRL
ncbi:hypothetical protein E2C01_095097 [Portunus trituberculatus]|uniref:Uncharacterized protein n=1 Tax=Portunus trituberculatus TaxID=210409 RepID=A0A5B7JXX3_PORTR|nr:hypothetical protein [Portunus trituberculatus]